ncbi:MAG: hypothetical protein IJY28_03600 [Clostridia bacterium]|nr:hypothetical protein [Clostridia bacterium]
MTKNEAKETALRWIDEATVNGCEPAAGELDDYRDRMDHLLDGVLQGLAAVFPLSGVWGVTHCPEKKLPGGSAAVQKIMPEERYELAHPAAGSVYLEISGAAEVQFPDGHTVKTADGGFTAVRGKLDGGHGITVSGADPFLVRNAALYETTYTSEEKIPAFAPWVPYALPEDLRLLRRVVRQWAGGESECTDYRCEDGRHLLLPYDRWGEYRIYYDRKPGRLSHDASDDTVLDCDPVAESLVPLKLAADVTMGTLDRAQTGYYLENRYASMVLTVQSGRPGDRVQIRPVFAMQ